MNNDLISREALKKATRELYKETPDGIVKFGIEKVYDLIDNAPAVEERPQGECGRCEYRKFSQKFADDIVELMAKNGITSYKHLIRILSKGGAKNEN